MFFNVAPVAYSLTVENEKKSLYEVFIMYIPKTRKFSTVPFSRKTFTVRVVRDKDDFAFNVKFEVSTFPCGRIRLIARTAGLIITGDKNNLFKDITFDSIRSLYTCPGFSVLTPPGCVYAFCGRSPRRIW